MPVTGPWLSAVRGAGLLAADGRVRSTVFAEMSALAAATGAINLGQGFPDEDGPAEVLEAAVRSIRDGVNQYPPGRGMAVLREAVAEHQSRFYGMVVDPGTEVLVTAGATEAIAATVLALVSPGDEVVTVEPYYDEYGAVIGLAGGIHRTVPLRHPGYRLDLDDLRAVVGDRTRLIIVNSPHNPTGTVLDTETLRGIVELAQRHDALIMTDEVYEHLVYDGAHTPIATLPGAWERTVSISSGGKTFSATGWKVGWAVGPAALIDAVLAVKQYLTYVNGAPFQPAIAAGLRLPDEFFRTLSGTLARKRDMLVGSLRAAGLGIEVPSAGYFVVADAAPLGVDDAAALCLELPGLVGVVAVPLSAFCAPESTVEQSRLRFAFCKRVEVLEDAAARLATLGDRLAQRP